MQVVGAIFFSEEGGKRGRICLFGLRRADKIIAAEIKSLSGNSKKTITIAYKK
jgi:hypothetical protein